MDDLRQMRTLLAIADEKSVRRAADALGITHGAVSRTLKRLEDIYGTLLFHRSKRQMTPTEAGAVLVRTARETLARFEDARRAIATISDRHMLGLSIAADSTLTLDLMLPVLSERIGIEGSARIDARTGDWPTMRPLLARGDIDIFLGVRPDEAIREFRVTHVPVSQPVLVVRKGHPLLDKHPLNFTDIQDYPGITTRIPDWVLKIVMDPLTHPERFRMAFTDNLDLIFETVRRNDAVSGGTPALFATQLRRGEFEILRFVDNPFQGQFRAVAVTREEEPPAAVARFLETLLKRAQENLEDG